MKYMKMENCPKYYSEMAEIFIHKCMDVCTCMPSCFNCVLLFATPWILAFQALLSMGFSRQEHWSGLPCPPPGDLPNPGIEPVSLMSPALASGFFITSATWEAPICAILFKNYVYWELRKIFLLRFLKMEWEWEEAFIEYLIDTGHLTYSIWPILIRALQIKLCYSFYRWRCAARNWQG